MAKILVVYYSSYGHTEQLAFAVAEGAQQAGATVEIRRIAETLSDEVLAKVGYKVNDAVPVVQADELKQYDGILFGTPTRFGMMAAQMKQFLDSCGGLWARGELIGKVAGVFTSTGTQHGGQEATILSFHTVLLHLGCVVTGLPYSFSGQTRMDEITGCSPYGASTIAAGDNQRQPSANELAGARFQGKYLAEIAIKLVQS